MSRGGMRPEAASNPVRCASAIESRPPETARPMHEGMRCEGHIRRRRLVNSGKVTCVACGRSGCMLDRELQLEAASVW